MGLGFGVEPSSEPSSHGRLEIKKHVDKPGRSTYRLAIAAGPCLQQVLGSAGMEASSNE